VASLQQHSSKFGQAAVQVLLKHDITTDVVRLLLQLPNRVRDCSTGAGCSPALGFIRFQGAGRVIQNLDAFIKGVWDRLLLLGCTTAAVMTLVPSEQGRW
jgi:hypothetical protein